MMRPTLSLGCLLTSLLLVGCGPALETDYEPPQVSIPATWTTVASHIKNIHGLWWQDFGDATLNALVEEALAKNNDLAAATFKVRKAQLAADLALDQFLPDVTGTGDASNSRNLKGKQTISRSYAVTGGVSYELDLWGKIDRQSDSAAWEARATEQDRESTALSLVGTTIKLYWKIAYLNERVSLSQQSIDYTQKILDLVQVKHEVGSSSALDEAEASQSLAKQQAAHTQYQQQLAEAHHAFAILFDAAPSVILKTNPATMPKGDLPQIAAGLPADLLGRRPDLRAAEMRLRESLADVDATRASYLPKFTLTGSLGSSSIALSDVLQNPIGAFGAGLTLPFLNLMDMTKNVEISQTSYEQAIVTFRQTLYQALSDAENALSARTHDIEQGKKLQVVFDEAKKAEDLYGVRYQEGYADLQSWLEAQETRRVAEASLLENRYTQLTDLVTLYEALGGSVPALSSP